MEQDPVGFCPTEKDLIFYLKNKVVGCNDVGVIPELKDFNAHDPWELPKLYDEIAKVPRDGSDCYFICPSPYVAQNRESNINRKTRSGSWKSTSKWFHVKKKPSHPSIGRKGTFRFWERHSASPTPIMTEWLMYEYQLNHGHRSGYSSRLEIPYILYHLTKRPIKSLNKSPTTQRDSTVTDDAAVASQLGSAENTDQEISLQATMAALPPNQTLDDNLPSHSLSGDLVPLQLDAHGDGQDNDLLEALRGEHCEDFGPTVPFILDESADEYDNLEWITSL